MEFRAQQLGREMLGRSSRENMERPKKRAEMDPENSETYGQQCSPKVLLQSLKCSKSPISLVPLEAQGHHPNKLCIPHPYWMQTIPGLALSKITRRAFLHISRSQAHCEVLVGQLCGQFWSWLIRIIQPAQKTEQWKKKKKGKRNIIAESSTEQPWILNTDVFIVILI